MSASVCLYCKFGITVSNANYLYTKLRRESEPREKETVLTAYEKRIAEER